MGRCVEWMAYDDDPCEPTVEQERTEVLPLVLSDLAKRVEKGTKEYGEPLSINNGRDALVDAYEEVLDLAMYLRQRIEEEK